MSTPDKCPKCFNAEQDAEILAMSVTTLKDQLLDNEAALTREREKWEKLREWAESTPAVLQDVVSEMNRLDAEAKDGQR